MPGEEVGGESGRRAAIARTLRSAADPDGVLPLDRFMEIALYAPGIGYYESPDRRLGREGDFYTAAHVHPLFGRSVAARIWAEFVRLGRPAGFRIVEVGPGDGTLAADIVAALAPQVPPERPWEYLLVERSHPLADAALRRLAALGDVRSITWRRSEGLGVDGPFPGVVLANELLDAMPVRRVVWRRGAWRDVNVRLSGAGAGWMEGLEPAEIRGSAVPDAASEGTVFDVAPGADGFVREVADHLLAGVAILLDYGAAEEELLLGHPRGTLSAVRAHRPVGDPLADPGEVDLSTFVNLTRLRAAAERSGLSEVAFRSQAEALGDWGLPALLEAAVGAAPDSTEQVRLRLAAKNLLFGFENFHVLELSPRRAG